MPSRFVITLESFTIKPSRPNTIFFQATCPTFHNDPFTLEYTGVDLNYTVSLPDQYMEAVRDQMKSIFQYGPFDTKKVQQALAKNWRFTEG